MMKYVLIFAGILIMCVPEDASFLRFAIQASIGLSIFIVGAISAITEESN